MATSAQTVQTSIEVAIDTKTSLDTTAPMSASQPDSPVATSLIPIHFLTKLHRLQNIQLHQLKDGTCFLQGWNGISSEKLELPKVDAAITLYFSIHVNQFQKKVLQITAHKPKPTQPSTKKSKIILEALNEGEIQFKNASIIFFSDIAHTFIPQDGAYVDKRISSFLDLIEVGLPIEKFKFMSPMQEERIALFQALTTDVFNKKDNKALEIVLTAGGMDKTQALTAIASESVTINTFSLPTATPASTITSPTPANAAGAKAFFASTATAATATSAAATSAATSSVSLKGDGKNIAEKLVVDSEQPIEDNNDGQQSTLPNTIAAIPTVPPAPILYSNQALIQMNESALIARRNEIAEHLDNLGLDDFTSRMATTPAIPPIPRITGSDVGANNEDSSCACVIL